MKYKELISFKPIETTIQLLDSGEKQKARELVETYVMSDEMADHLQTPLIDQLQMNEVVDNKGVLVVGNYGTGKSHLMSMVSAVATNADNLPHLQNQFFAKSMEPIAGKFEVLRIEIGGVTMCLRELLCNFIEEDFQSRGIDYTFPDLDKVTDNKRLVRDFMTAFGKKYPDKGYLIVVDEFFAYLTSRDERQIVLDLEFFRALGEMCSKSKLRVIFGVQEKIFDNPRFGFVQDTLKHVGDRFTQVIIRKEDTAYVVSERILKKTTEQKALIRAHLEKFSSLYGGMAARMDEFVDMFPIHPSYVGVLNRAYLVENRHILKNVSVCIKDVFDQDVPTDAPGVISFDSYWPVIKSNGMLRSDPEISRVLNASQQLEDIINRSFPKPHYKTAAIKIIYALSVHRLTTNGLDVQAGLTAENLRDDLCLYLTMPENDAEFLLSTVNVVLRDIMTTVSGQFIIHNEANNQYYIDVNKVIDYDERVKQKASILAESELNRYFFKIVYGCLSWNESQYVTGFEIYQYDLNWDSHNMFRAGYLFMGVPDDRSTAQPERDFYVYIMPPYDGKGDPHDLKDEVYLNFKSTDEFRTDLERYAAASSLAAQSEGKDKDAYNQKAEQIRKKLIKYLGTHVSTSFDVSYKGVCKQLVEVLKGRYDRDAAFKETIDLAASLALDGYFCEKYPKHPAMKTKITRANMADAGRQAYDYIAGRKEQLGQRMLQSFDLLDGDKIRPDGSAYAQYYIKKLAALPPQGVINHADIFEDVPGRGEMDTEFGVNALFMGIVFLALAYSGHMTIKTSKGTIDAGNLDQVPKAPTMAVYDFNCLAKPAALPMAELRRLFDTLGLNAGLLNSPGTRDNAAEELVKFAKELSNDAAKSVAILNSGFELWGEPLANAQERAALRDACTAVNTEFSNYGSKFNTAAKLNNFSHSEVEVDELGKQVDLARIIPEYLVFKNACTELVSYISGIEYGHIGDNLAKQIDSAKGVFRSERDNIFDGASGGTAAQKAIVVLDKVRAAYIDLYIDEHSKKRLGIKDAQRRSALQESGASSNLRKLSKLDILPQQKYDSIANALAGLGVCYELTPAELKASSACPHCHYTLGDASPNVAGQLDSLEQQIDDLVEEWTGILCDTMTDPLVQGQMGFLKPDQKAVIDRFLESGKLPEKVDDFFVSAIEDLLDGFEPVYVDGNVLLQELTKLGPCDLETFKKKLGAIVAGYTKGKDAENLRIIVKSE